MSERLMTKTEAEALSIGELERVLKSDEHYRRTVTRNYGNVDPLVEPGACAFRCGEGCAAGLKQKPGRGGDQQTPLAGAHTATKVFAVECDKCGRRGQSSLRAWRAVVDWSFLMASDGFGRIEDLPVFNVKAVSESEALRHLSSVRYDLMLRVILAKKERDAGMDVGPRYLAKLEALLGWANVGIKVLTRGSEAGGRRVEREIVGG